MTMRRAITRYQTVRIDELTFLAELQGRAAINEEAVLRYSALLDEGVDLEPVDVYVIEGEPHLVHGWHRIRSLESKGRKEVHAAMHVGSMDDAKVFSACANSQGQAMVTNADKRRMIQMVLEVHPEWKNRHVARAVGYPGSRHTVGDVRKLLFPAPTPDAPEPDDLPADSYEDQQDENIDALGLAADSAGNITSQEESSSLVNGANKSTPLPTARACVNLLDWRDGDSALLFNVSGGSWLTAVMESEPTPSIAACSPDTTAPGLRMAEEQDVRALWGRSIMEMAEDQVDWVIGCPELSAGPEQVLQALRVAKRGAAILLPATVLTAGGDWGRLFDEQQPKQVGFVCSPLRGPSSVSSVLEFDNWVFVVWDSESDWLTAAAWIRPVK